MHSLYSAYLSFLSEKKPQDIEAMLQPRVKNQLLFSPFESFLIEDNEQILQRTTPLDLSEEVCLTREEEKKISPGGMDIETKKMNDWGGLIRCYYGNKNSSASNSINTVEYGETRGNASRPANNNANRTLLMKIKKIKKESFKKRPLQKKTRFNKPEHTDIRGVYKINDRFRAYLEIEAGDRRDFVGDYNTIEEAEAAIENRRSLGRNTYHDRLIGSQTGITKIEPATHEINNVQSSHGSRRDDDIKRPSMNDSRKGKLKEDSKHGEPDLIEITRSQARGRNDDFQRVRTDDHQRVRSEDYQKNRSDDYQKTRIEEFQPQCEPVKLEQPHVISTNNQKYQHNPSSGKIINLHSMAMTDRPQKDLPQMNKTGHSIANPISNFSTPKQSGDSMITNSQSSYNQSIGIYNMSNHSPSKVMNTMNNSNMPNMIVGSGSHQQSDSRSMKSQSAQSIQPKPISNSIPLNQIKRERDDSYDTGLMYYNTQSQSSDPEVVILSANPPNLPSQRKDTTSYIMPTIFPLTTNYQFDSGQNKQNLNMGIMGDQPASKSNMIPTQLRQSQSSLHTPNYNVEIHQYFKSPAGSIYGNDNHRSSNSGNNFSSGYSGFNGNTYKSSVSSGSSRGEFDNKMHSNNSYDRNSERSKSGNYNQSQIQNRFAPTNSNNNNSSKGFSGSSVSKKQFK